MPICARPMRCRNAGTNRTLIAMPREQSISYRGTALHGHAGFDGHAFIGAAAVASLARCAQAYRHEEESNDGVQRGRTVQIGRGP
jgi:hypothetical protein